MSRKSGLEGGTSTLTHNLTSTQSIHITHDNSKDMTTSNENNDKLEMTTDTETTTIDAIDDHEKQAKTHHSNDNHRNAVLAVVFYWVTSLALVFLNKVVMVGDVINLDAPLFMSWTQFVITVICCWMLGVSGKYIQRFSYFPPFEYKLSVAKKVMPLTFVFLGMIVFNNLCLKYVEVSFYQVARALTMVFNMLFTYLLLGKKTTRDSILCCLVIICGYLMGCDGEIHFSIQGVVFGLLSSAFVALNAIYVNKILPVVDENSEKLMMYNNINASLLLPAIIYFSNEKEQIATHLDVFHDSLFWTIATVAGVMGYLINFASYLQIKYTSPLSHNVSGTAKAAAQTVIALIIFRNPVTTQGMVGCAVVIIASFVYSQIKKK